MGRTTVDMSPLVNKVDFDFKFDLSWYKFNTCTRLKPGFHIVVSVVSAVSVLTKKK